MEGFLVWLGVPEAWVAALNLGLLARLLLAAVLGGAIGLERELSGKPAGLRTNLLICVGAALLTDLSLSVAEAANVENAAAGVPFRADPSRIAAQIVSGIGFLGAGTIMQARGSVTGLTTAATLWVVAAIGMAVGSRSYLEAAGSTLLVYVSLVVLGRFENVLLRRRKTRRYILGVNADPARLEEAETVFRSAGLSVETGSLEKTQDRFEVSLEVSGPARAHEQAVRSLFTREWVHRISRET